MEKRSCTWTSSSHGDDQLIARYIENNPHQPGPADVRIAGRGVAVWALIGHLPAVHRDVAQLAREFRLTVEETRAALAHYERHKDMIDARIEANAV